MGKCDVIDMMISTVILPSSYARRLRCLPKDQKIVSSDPTQDKLIDVSDRRKYK